MPAPKTFFYKVYGGPSTSSPLISTWQDAASPPRFTWPINNGPGHMEVTLGRRPAASRELHDSREYRYEVFRDKPAAYWRLNDLRGTTQGAKDEVGGRNLAYVGTTLQAPGVLSGDAAVSFDGVDDYAQYPGVPVSAAPWTVEAWARPNTLSQTGVIFALGSDAGGVSIAQSNGGVNGPDIQIIRNGLQYLDTGRDFKDTVTFRHIVATFNGGTLKAYVDGQEVLSLVTSFGSPVAKTSVGALYTADGLGLMRFFNGTIDEVAAYNTVLSAERVRSHYEAAAPADLVLGNLVEVVVVKNGVATAIYQGHIREYSLDQERGEIRVILVPRTTALQMRFVETDNEHSGDPLLAAKFYVDNGYIPGVTWNSANPASSGANVPPFHLKQMKMVDVLNRTRELCGHDWFYILTPDHKLTFRQFDTSGGVTHKLILGQQATLAPVRVSAIDQRGKVLVFGAGGVLLGQASVAGYDDSVDPSTLAVADSRIEDGATARRIAVALLGSLQYVAYESEVTVADDAFGEAGYDLESLKPGDAVQLVEPERVWRFHRIGDHIYGDGHIIGGPWWAQQQRSQIIHEVEYNFDHVLLKVAHRPRPPLRELLAISDRLFESITQ